MTNNKYQIAIEALKEREQELNKELESLRISINSLLSSSDQKKKFYDALIANDRDFMHSYARNASSAFFITNMVEAYFKELSKFESKPTKIALELSNSKILVWAEIKEDDESMEDALILTEAKINSYFYEYGFHISSTIIEDCDGLNVPSHYKNVALA